MALAAASRAHAQPFVVSVVPANGATGVSPSAPVVFTFNEEMDTAVTVAFFVDPMSPFTPLPTTDTWSADGTVLTCTPVSPFPSNRQIFWSVSGESLIAEPLEDEFGLFTTGSSGGGTGTGTNRITSFQVSKLHFFGQATAAAPVPDSEAPYVFHAQTILASNRTAIGIALTLPTGGISNLTQNIIAPESYFLLVSSTNLGAFNAAFPAGNYVFNVMASTSNQQVTVNVPSGLTAPNAPHIVNYSAAQSINAALPFQLTWDPFQGGTVADHISVSVGQVFQSPAPGEPGALNGTATAITLPANTLQPGSSYDATINFFRSTGTSNASYSTSALVATSTDFSIAASSGTGTGPLELTNGMWLGGAFAFDVISSPGQAFIVEQSATLATNGWQALLATNSVTGWLRITNAAAAPHLFYRARKSP